MKTITITVGIGLQLFDADIFDGDLRTVEIVSDRDHREQEHHCTACRDQSQSACLAGIAIDATSAHRPRDSAGRCQQPERIEQDFHNVLTGTNNYIAGL
ncbi:MAG TPA: hypothetical protein VN622_18140 [Clostridia bacterium]|nr:hypothetical protein [Clostridia bacterium]